MLIGAGDVAFLRTITIVAALGAFVPLTLAASHWDWGIGGVWAGLTAFIMVAAGRDGLARTDRPLGGSRLRLTGGATGCQDEPMTARSRPAARRRDVLGAPYTAETLELPDDEEGKVVATLVRRPARSGRAGRRTTKAVLHVHGFADYFFQTAYAEWWNERGYDFFALDLRKYGRSILPHQTPNYVADLTDYYPELDLAWDRVDVRAPARRTERALDGRADRAPVGATARRCSRHAGSR